MFEMYQMIGPIIFSQYFFTTPSNLNSLMSDRRMIGYFSEYWIGERIKLLLFFDAILKITGSSFKLIAIISPSENVF